MLRLQELSRIITAASWVLAAAMSAPALEYPLSYFDDLRTSPDASFEVRADSSVVLVNDTIRLCQLTSLLPITSRRTSPDGQRQDDIEVIPSPFYLFREAAALLAAKHFNDRSSVIVPDLAERLEGCNVYLTVDLRDSQLSPIVGSRQILEAAYNVKHSLETPLPAGIMGALTSKVSVPVAVLAGVQQIPQMSPTATSQQLENRESFPYFARAKPTNAGDAAAFVKYMQRLGVSHFGVAYTREPYGSSYFADLFQAAKQVGIKVVGAPYEELRPESIDSVIARLKESELRYFVGIFFDNNIKFILNKLCDAGLIGNEEHTWFFTDSLATLKEQGFQLDANTESSVAKAVNGSGLILVQMDGNLALDQGMAEYLTDDHHRAYFISRHAEQDIFNKFNLSDIPLTFSAFNTLVYDSIMTMGFAACQAPEQFFTGPQLYEQMKSTEFTGSSGFMAFDPITGSRLGETVNFQIVNIVAQPPSQDGFIRFNSKQSAVIRHVNKVAYVEERSPFVYWDGTTVPPLPLPSVEEDLNLISIGVRAFGWTLAGIIMVLSLGWMCWSIQNRDKPVIRASQPIFLCMVCIGTFIMASSIIPMSLQEPVNERGLDIACMAQPWLYSVGFVTSFSALFSKTYRLNQLFKMSRACRRVKITAKDVLTPFMILMSLNFMILTTWTIVAPREWTRIEKSSSVDRFGRSTESYGRCNGLTEDAHYVLTPLWMLVNFVAVIIATYQAYVSRKLPPTNYKESKHIALSLVIVLEAHLLAIPVYSTSGAAPTAEFVITLLLTSSICLGILLPVFIPKFVKRNRALEGGSERRSITTSVVCHNSRHGQEQQRSSNVLQTRTPSVYYARQNRQSLFSLPFSGATASLDQQHQTVAPSPV